MDHAAGEELSCAADDLLVFIDDIGHEEFAGNQPYYGLGGCAIIGADYDRLKVLWRDVRQQINGIPNAPLHAADMSRDPKNYAVLSRFFIDRSFLRMAVTALKGTPLPVAMHPAVPVMGALHEDIQRVAAFLPCAGLKIVFESSEKADPVVKRRFGELDPNGKN